MQRTNWDHSPKIHATLQQRLHNAITWTQNIRVKNIKFRRKKKKINIDYRPWEKRKIIISRSNLNPNSLPVIYLGQVSGRIVQGAYKVTKINEAQLQRSLHKALDTKTVHERLTINIRCPNIIKIGVNIIHRKNK